MSSWISNGKKRLRDAVNRKAEQRLEPQRRNSIQSTYRRSIAVTATTSASIQSKTPISASMDQFTILNKNQGAFEAQQILEEQRRQQALLLLQQQPQQLLDKTLAAQGVGLGGLAGVGVGVGGLADLGPHGHGPGAGHFVNGGHSHSHSAIYGAGASPLDIECRNIIALQEELKRQEIKRKAEEIINQKVHEQALLLELQKQAEMQQQQQQQNSTTQLLGRFAELDQLVAHQEILARLNQEQQQRSALNNLEHLHAASVGLHGGGHVTPSSLRDSLGVSGAGQQSIIDALRSQRNNLDSVSVGVSTPSTSLQGLHQRLRSPLSDPNPVLSSTADISRVLSNVNASVPSSFRGESNFPKNIQALQSLQSLGMMSGRGGSQQNNDFMSPSPSTQQQGGGGGGSGGSGTLLQQNNYLPTSASANNSRLSCHSSHSNDGIQYGNNLSSNSKNSSGGGSGVPEIRYFNNGSEVARDGSRAFPSSDKTSNGNGKKRRIIESEVISLDDDDVPTSVVQKGGSVPNKKSKFGMDRDMNHHENLHQIKVKKEPDVVHNTVKVKTEKVESVSISSRSSSRSSSASSLMNRCNLPKKNIRKLSELCSTTASRRLDIPEATTPVMKMKVRYEQRQQQQQLQQQLQQQQPPLPKRQSVRPNSRDEREEEKVDAANMLLGLMKNA